MKIVITALLFFIPFYSNAWGVQGHRVVGGIAEHYLSPKAKAEIKRILGNESIAMASNWGDFIKSDRSFNYLSPWHYINIPSGLNAVQFYDKLRKDSSANLYNKLQFLIKELGKKTLPKEKKLFYLKLIIHFVGDVHQPMHVGRPGDRGGNDIKLYWFSTPTNLHRVWDENLIDFQQLSYTEHIAAINFVTEAQKQKWQKDQLSVWFYESYQVAEKIYSDVKPEERLSYNYNFHNVTTMNQQLLKGGVRLAGVLNSIFSAY